VQHLAEENRSYSIGEVRKGSPSSAYHNGQAELNESELIFGIVHSNDGGKVPTSGKASHLTPFFFNEGQYSDSSLGTLPRKPSHIHAEPMRANNSLIGSEKGKRLGKQLSSVPKTSITLVQKGKLQQNVKLQF